MAFCECRYLILCNFMATVDLDYLHRLNTKWPSLDTDIRDYILLYIYF